MSSPKCKQCGGELQPRSRGRILATRYCSQQCQRQRLRDRAHKRREDSRYPCPVCKVPFVPKWTGRSFSTVCSAKCRHDADFVTATCAACGKTFRARRAQVRRSKWQACSVECRTAHNRGAAVSSFRGGDGTSGRGKGWTALKPQIRERDGHRCRRCGRQHQPPERLFPVDHIMPWRSFTDKAAANDPSNLATLCPTCHTRKTMIEEQALLMGDWLTFRKYLQDIGL